jgi:hypothetical protein
MIMEEATLFYSVGSALESGENVSKAIDLKYNGDSPTGKLTLFVPAQTGTKSVSVTLEGCDTEEGTYTAIRAYTGTPDENGFVVADLMPKGLKRYVRLKITTAEAIKVTAGMNFGTPEEFNHAWIDPAVVFAP